MARAGYSVVTPAAVALGAGAATTILWVIAAADYGLDLKSCEVSFDGITAGATPAFVEVTYLTGASQVTPGTNNTAVTPVQEYGRVLSPSAMAAGAACTSEPTVQTRIKGGLLTPYAGKFAYDWPDGRTPDSAFAQGFAIRVTAPGAVNARGEIHFERL